MAQGEEVGFLLRSTTGDEEQGPPTETLTRRAEKSISSCRACSDLPRSSTIPRGSKIVTRVCDNVVRIDDFSTNPASLQPSSASLPRFWCPS